MAKLFLEVLSGEDVTATLWLMRQAGRLPEYRQLRKRAGDFWLCYTPGAVEVTLQPIKRWLRCGILFSDILVVPDGLGQDVAFVEGTGPVLTPVRDADRWRVIDSRLAKGLGTCL